VHSIHSLAELHGSANGKLMEHAPLPAKYASADEPITGMLRTRCTAHRALVPDVFDFKGVVVHTHGKMVLGNGRPAASLLVLVLVHSNLRHEMEPSRVVPRPSDSLSPLAHAWGPQCFTRPPTITILHSLESANHHLVLVL